MLRALIVSFLALFRARADLVLEILVLRQQLAVLTQGTPRPKLSAGFRLFWVTLRRIWPKWREALVLVRPETVIRWHRQGFRAFWRWRSSRRAPGRPRIDAELRKLIRRIVAENPTWGAPRVHGELLLLGFDISERTISRYLRGRPVRPDAVESWKRFLELHRKALVGMDFFSVSTAPSRCCTCWCWWLTIAVECSTGR